MWLFYNQTVGNRGIDPNYLMFHQTELEISELHALLLNHGSEHSPLREIYPDSIRSLNPRVDKIPPPTFTMLSISRNFPIRELIDIAENHDLSLERISFAPSWLPPDEDELQRRVTESDANIFLRFAVHHDPEIVSRYIQEFQKHFTKEILQEHTLGRQSRK